ncbi:MAG: hypothetical protein HRT71_02490 [Flavobacteriales bacterium]|nr:hypothetical protein [Flavobacteriales bacterium]
MKHLLLLPILFVIACSTPEQSTKMHPGLNNYNVVWTDQSKNSSESMPLVGGDIGCNVWVENGDLLLYVMRSGSLSENGEYLKMGRFRIQMDPNPFVEGNTFKQELKLVDGNIEIEAMDKEGNKTVVNLWVDVFNPLVHIEVESANKVDITASYESWRMKDWELMPGKYGERFTCFSMSGHPDRLFRVKDEIQFENNGVLFYHKNPNDSNVTTKLIKQQGLEASADEIYDDIKDRTFGGMLFGNGFIEYGNDEGEYLHRAYKAWKLKSDEPREKHHLVVATHIDQIENIEDWKTALAENVKQASNSAADYEKTVTWWNEFWNRSYVLVNYEKPDTASKAWQMSRNYNLFRYQLGGNAFGEYPTKFNGGNLNYDALLVDENYNYGPDYRKWGGAIHTAQNQRLLYWPMLKAGDFDAILPQFDLYVKALPGATARVKTNFGHKGSVYSEYASATGLVWGAGWGWHGESHRKRGPEFDFGVDSLAIGARSYNQLVEKGVMSNQSCNYHWESQVEHAYMMLEYHRFSGNDISKYMPFIKSAIIFFDEHYQLRQKLRNGETLDPNGKLNIYPSTSCESYRGAKNPSDLVAGLRVTLTSMLALDDKYMSADEKKYFAEYLERVPEVTFGVQDGLRIVMPAESWTKEANIELPQFYPLFPFDQYKIGDEEIQSFKNAFELAEDRRKGRVESWHQDGIQFARMGMTQEAADFNTWKLENSKNRFPTFWGPGHDWTPDHNHGGSGMIGVQEMLMQTIGDQIVLFPAWPKDWDVDFKLNAPYQTVVEVVLKDGKVVELKVTPESRKKDVVLMIE